MKESMVDPSFLSVFSILASKRAGGWTLLRVAIQRDALPGVLGPLGSCLRTEKGVPFFAHFYRPGEVIVVFPGKVFRMTPDRSSWASAIAFGRSVGVPAEELDFAPCRFEDETW